MCVPGSGAVYCTKCVYLEVMLCTVLCVYLVVVLYTLLCVYLVVVLCTVLCVYSVAPSPTLGQNLDRAGPRTLVLKNIRKG